MDIAAEIQKLEQLRQSGAVTDEEFALAKEKLLAMPPSDDAAFSEEDTRRWAMILHLSQLAGFVIPLGGFLAPILIWQIKKNDLPELDVHGKLVVNWLISELIYSLICLVLVFVVIGVPMIFVLGVIGTVFPIIGGLKANNGVVWPYPMTIRFLK